MSKSTRAPAACMGGRGSLCWRSDRSSWDHHEMEMRRFFYAVVLFCSAWFLFSTLSPVLPCLFTSSPSCLRPSLLSSPLLSCVVCGPVVIILWPLRFTVMSPHLRLIVFRSHFLTQSIFNTFFLLTLNPSPHSSFLAHPVHFSPRPHFNLYQYFHSFPFFKGVIVFDCHKASTVPLPNGWKWWRGVWQRLFVSRVEIRGFLEVFVLLLCVGWQMFARVNISLCMRVCALV